MEVPCVCIHQQSSSMLELSFPGLQQVLKELNSLYMERNRSVTRRSKERLTVYSILLCTKDTRQMFSHSGSRLSGGLQRKFGQISLPFREALLGKWLGWATIDLIFRFRTNRTQILTTKGKFRCKRFRSAGTEIVIQNAFRGCTPCSYTPAGREYVMYFSDDTISIVK